MVIVKKKKKIKLTLILFQKISFLGGTREYVVSNLPTPYGLTVFGNIIYWVDRNLKKIFKSPKSGQVMPAPKWLKAGLHSLADIVMFDRKKQPNGKMKTITLSFLSGLPQAWHDIGVQFSICLFLQPSTLATATTLLFGIV